MTWIMAIHYLNHNAFVNFFLINQLKNTEALIQIPNFCKENLTLSAAIRFSQRYKEYDLSSDELDNTELCQRR